MADDELSEERRREIEEKVTAEVADEQWRLIDERMRMLEGQGWASAEEDAELCQIADGPQTGRVFWRVGDREFFVEGDNVIERTITPDGRPTHRRLIGPEGVVTDEPIIYPGLN